MITVSAHSSNRSVNIKIEDLGIGINDHEKEKIFERFYRSEKVGKLGIRGYGLGLSLVKYVISSMGGTIKIQPNKPTGTVFIITIPTVNME